MTLTLVSPESRLCLFCQVSMFLPLETLGIEELSSD